MLFANNANTTLASGITSSATSISVTSSTGFPSPTGSQYFYCTLADAATQQTIEIVQVTAVSGTTWTVVRGQDGTTGTAFSVGAVVSLRLVRASLNDFPKLDENNTFSYAPTFNTALGVASGGTGVTSATGTGAGAAVVLNQAPAINSPVITAYSTSTVPLKIYGLSGQFTELFDVYTYNGGTLAFQINSSGAIATGTWNGSVIGAAYGGTGEAGTLTGILYGNGTSAHTVATTAQLLSGIGTLPVANGGTGQTSFTSGYVHFGSFTTSSNLYWDNTNYRLGIGTTSPAYNLDISNGTYKTSIQVDSGDNAVIFSNTSGTKFTIGSSIGIVGPGDYMSVNHYTGSSWSEFVRFFNSGGVSIGNTTDPGAGNLYVNGLIGVGSSPATYNRLFNNAASISLNVQNNSTTAGSGIQIGSATTAGNTYVFIDCYSSINGTPVNQFRVRGDGVIYAQNTTVQSLSDVRTKENIVDSTEGINVVMALRPVRFDFKEGFGNNKKNQLNFIAQEIEKVFPDAVDIYGESDNPDKPYKSVGPSALIPVLVKAIQDLNNKFDVYIASHP